MLSETLKEATLAAHQQLEKKMAGRLKAVRTLHDYAALLSLFYGYFGGLETAIEQHIDATNLPDYRQRRKVAALAADLQQLQAPLPAQAGKNNLPDIANPAQALGALYVMEGSTLGGKMIAKMMRQQLSLADTAALHFFSGYGEQTGAMWQSFKAALNQPLPAAEQQQVVQAANDTFTRFRQWFDLHTTG